MDGFRESEGQWITPWVHFSIDIRELPVMHFLRQETTGKFADDGRRRAERAFRKQLAAGRAILDWDVSWIGKEKRPLGQKVRRVVPPVIVEERTHLQT